MTCDHAHCFENCGCPAQVQANPSWLTADYEEATMYTFDQKERTWKAKKVVVKIDAQPFSQGTFRFCHKMHLGDPKDSTDKGKDLVLKVFKEAKSPEAYFSEAMAQILSSTYTAAFNESSERKVKFLPVCVLKLHERNDAFATAEPFLSGKYVKHNDNDGHVDTCDALPQAFSHFTWAASKRKLLVVDIQGCGETYTDPSIQCVTDDENAFGDGNCGRVAIMKFFASHTCSSLCRAHGLPSAEKELMALGSSPKSATSISPKQGRREQQLQRAAAKAAAFNIPKYPVFFPKDVASPRRAPCKPCSPEAAPRRAESQPSSPSTNFKHRTLDKDAEKTFDIGRAYSSPQLRAICGRKAS